MKSDQRELLEQTMITLGQDVSRQQFVEELFRLPVQRIASAKYVRVLDTNLVVFPFLGHSSWVQYLREFITTLQIFRATSIFVPNLFDACEVEAINLTLEEKLVVIPYTFSTVSLPQIAESIRQALASNSDGDTCFVIVGIDAVCLPELLAHILDVTRPEKESTPTFESVVVSPNGRGAARQRRREARAARKATKSK